MLYLGDGVRDVKVGDDQAIQVFPDFGNPSQFYYLPNFPRIAMMPDGSPAIRMLVYREDLTEIDDDDEEAVAFLSVDVDLRWDPELIEEAAAKIRLADNLTDTPRLAPVLFTEGSVRMMLLDSATPDDDDDDDDAAPTRFVTKITGSGSPSLYGDNRAIFQATLPKRGASALAGALDGVTPIGIVYSLTFAGLQPAFHVRANVDWTKVHEHFSERENTNVLFYEKDVQKSIDELVDERAIEIDVTVEGIGAAAMDADREQAMTLVRQLIFEKFFEATFERETPAGGGTGDQVADTLRTIGQDAITMGIGYTYSTKEVTISELRSLNLDWTARRAVERVIYPQAHMHNLLSDSGLTLDDVVTVVDGSDGVWKSMPIEVVATAAWEADGIAGISVELEYTDADSGVVHSVSEFLDKDAPTFQHRDWMDRTSGNRLRYKYEVVFADDDVPGPSPKVSSVTDDAEWIEYEGTTVTIHPRDLYESQQIDVSLIPGFSFETWPTVHAFVRYRTDDGTFEHRADELLKAERPAFTTRFRTDKGVPGQTEVRLTYFGSTMSDRVDTDWEPVFERHKVVEDPHSHTLDVQAIVAGDRSKIANLIVDLRYVDADNGIFEEGRLMFSPENINMPQPWSVQRADPTKRRYLYRMTLVTTDGDFIETGWISTDSPTLPVGEKFVRTLVVEAVTAELGDDIREIKVALQYDDDDNDIHELETVELGGGARHEWRVQLADAGKRSYQYTITWKTRTGFNRSIGPVTTSDTLIVIPGEPAT